MVGPNPYALSMLANTGHQMSRDLLEEEIRLRQVYQSTFADLRAKGESLDRADKLTRLDEAYLAQERRIADLRQQRDTTLDHVRILRGSVAQQGPTFEQAIVELVTPFWYHVDTEPQRRKLVAAALKLVETIDQQAQEAMDKVQAEMEAKADAETANA